MRVIVVLLLLASCAGAQTLQSNIPYAEPANERQMLDVYAPEKASSLPVVLWIHGGGWQTGDKTSVQQKPQAFTERGFVFVSTNHRFVTKVAMGEVVRDVAQAVGWVYRNIARHGGDPRRIFIMGHSSGAQLAALVATDDRYLREVGVPFSALRGCVAVDGDTYDIPAIIATAELRQTVHGLPLPEFGHRVKFGNDPRLHIDFSAVAHIAKGKGIPPFLVLHIAGQPDVTAQARRLGAALKAAEIPVTIFAANESTHNRINADLGKSDDPATIELFRFLMPLVKGGQ
ncbi:MAG: alpha/beta hydrolase [Acidobacteriota bacterium]